MSGQAELRRLAEKWDREAHNHRILRSVRHDGQADGMAECAADVRRLLTDWSGAPEGRFAALERVAAAVIWQREATDEATRLEEEFMQAIGDTEEDRLHRMAAFRRAEVAGTEVSDALAALEAAGSASRCLFVMPDGDVCGMHRESAGHQCEHERHHAQVGVCHRFQP